MALTKLTTDLIDGNLGGGTTWVSDLKTANFTAVAGEGYFVDTTSAAITVTLPSSPTAGDEVSLVDYGANAATNNITITSSDNIEGASDDLVLSADKVSKTLVYSNATKGWLIANEVAGVAAPVPDLTVDYLVVAGGGGAGGHRGNAGQSGGGGGAGGLRTSYGNTSGGGNTNELALSLVLATNYTVTIGAGGTGSIYNGSNGSDSVFSGITSIGGGFGAQHDPSGNAGSGGSGGGRGSGGGGTYPSFGSGTANQGYNGGSHDIQSPYNAAGGGGAGAVGVSGGSLGTGGGGAGINVGITGSSVGYAGGGAGGYRSSNSNYSNSTASAFGGGVGGSSFGTVGGAGGTNTGGGGGGGSQATGGDGGSGIVILRYPDYYNITVGGGLTTGALNTAVGSNEKYTTFIAGTGSIVFGAV